MKNVIHIYGASGSGTSTLGKKLAEKLGYRWMDTDDYFWMPTNPPYTKKREIPERIRMMKRDIAEAENVVISGSLVDWGDVLIPQFTLAIRLVTDTDVRIERIRLREKAKFGIWIEPGGDMYQNHLEFLAWAKAYDSGDIHMRSRAKHDEWQKLLVCEQIVLDGAVDLEHNAEQVKTCLEKMEQCRERCD